MESGVITKLRSHAAGFIKLMDNILILFDC